MKKLITVGLLSMAATSTAFANEGFYLGASYTDFRLEETTTPGAKVDLGIAGILAGYRFTENFALEGRVSMGANDGNLGPAEFEIDSFVAVNVLGSIPLGNQGFSLYGTLGYGRAEISVTAPGLSGSDSETSANYGFGLMYTTGPWSVRGGYESLFDKNDLEATGVTLTATYAF